MKKIFTLMCAFLCTSIMLFAQINEESPFPVDFVIESPSEIAGTYGYGTQSTDDIVPIWGPTLAMDVRGEIVWAYDANDSLGCEMIVGDLTGKLALIRRGVCNFSTKVWNAELAGAAGVIIVNHYDNPDDDSQTLFGMLWGANMEPVTIPAIFVSRNTGERLASQLDAGVTVQGAFELRNLTLNEAPFAYQTPLDQALPITPQVNFFNEDSFAMVTPMVTATVIEPDGTTTQFSESAEVGALGDSVFTFQAFTPTQMGDHMVMFTSDLNTDTLRSPFEMTEFTYAVDTGNPTGGVSIGNTRFVAANNEFHVGSAYYTGPDGAVATHASFAISNPDTVFTGRSDADLFSLVVYDMDPLNTGTLGAGYDDFGVVGFGGYTLNGSESPNDILTVPFFDPITLKPNGGYAVMVQYLGEAAGTGKAPSFSVAGATNYPLPSTLVYEPEDFFTGGWNSNNNHVVRMHLEGFEFTNTVDVLESEKFNIFPNPATDVVSLELDLEKNSDLVRVVITDITGKVISNQKFENVQKQTLEFNVSTFSTGAYLMNIITDEGFTINKFVVTK